MNEPLPLEDSYRDHLLRHPRPASQRHRRFNIVVVLFSHVIPTAAVLFAIYQIAFLGIYPSALDLWLCLGFFLLTLFGLEIGYHRYFAHGAFKTSQWFENVLAVLGTVTFEGGVIWWTGTHKRHHAFSDAEGDPHSPHYELHGGVRGFVYGHIGWLFDPANINLGPWIQHVMPMYRNPFLTFLNRYYFQLGVAFLLLPAVIGWLVAGTAAAAWSALLWGGLIRVFLVTHAIFSLNSVCHMFGTKDFKAPYDESRNNAWIALYTLGASWHNNHHAFPRTASNQFRWWEIDISGMMIGLLERAGIIWDVWRPTKAQVQSRRVGKGAATQAAGK
ncbi:MAG: acyl-CoA desaturase [Sulfurifustaceae bacterium]